MTATPLTEAERAQIIQPLDEGVVVNSGLEDTLVSAYQEIRETMRATPGIDDLRTAAFFLAIERVARSYRELGVFP